MIEEKFDDFLAELMKNPKFKEEYDALKPEFDAISAELDAKEQGERREQIAVCRPAARRRTVRRLNVRLRTATTAH